MRLSDKLPTGAKTIICRRLNREDAYLRSILACIMLILFCIPACSHRSIGPAPKPVILEANNCFARGDYAASLTQYEKLLAASPAAADRLFFEMGVIHAHPGNGGKDYPKALKCFRKIISDFPKSNYRRDSQMMVLQIRNVIIKDKLIAEQQAQIDGYRQEIENLKAVKTFDRKPAGSRSKLADRILVEKKKRRMTLFSKGKTLKIYKIALGRNPVGPKEERGDNKTPEGRYTIKARNWRSKYHLSLRISYPNKKDRQQAKKRGVDPGGDIMIHGLKKDLAWVGKHHIKKDWTEGCIAVTNREIEEIERLVPNGTTVEIRP